MDPDGSNQVRVTDNPGIDEYPTWSPDGTRIAFHCTMGGVNQNGTGDFEICVVNRDGSGLHRLTDTPGENTQPDWSPDGEWIAFESNRLGWPSLPTATPAGYDPDTFGDEDVWVMRTDGSQQRNLTSNPLEGDSFPAWSPDGSWIVFSRGMDSCTSSLETAPTVSHSPTARGPTASRTGPPEPKSTTSASLGYWMMGKAVHQLQHRTTWTSASSPRQIGMSIAVAGAPGNQRSRTRRAGISGRDHAVSECARVAARLATDRWRRCPRRARCRLRSLVVLAARCVPEGRSSKTALDRTT